MVRGPGLAPVMDASAVAALAARLVQLAVASHAAAGLHAPVFDRLAFLVGGLGWSPRGFGIRNVRPKMFLDGFIGHSGSNATIRGQVACQVR